MEQTFQIALTNDQISNTRFGSEKIIADLSETEALLKRTSDWNGFSRGDVGVVGGESQLRVSRLTHLFNSN